MESLRGCGGVLTFGQAVDTVVEQNDVEIDVPAASMNKVIAANG